MISVEISIDLVEEMFAKSYYNREFEICSTMIIELKNSMENYISDRLQRGHKVDIQGAFDFCSDEMVDCDDEWDDPWGIKTV